MCGGGNRIRTDDPLLAGQVLYQLSYTPILFANLSLCENKCSPFKEACFLLKMNKKETFISDRLRNGQIVQLAIRLFSLKGGDPAAPSDTATLLRLHPSHRSYLRQLLPFRVRSLTSGTPNSHGVTGGVYKTRERIHPDMLIRDY